MSGPRVLTFNFHEPYLWLMAKSGLDFTIGLYDTPPLARAWHEQYRPVPPNMRLVPESAWRRDLESGKFDVVVTHNEFNAADLFATDTPKILVFHNRKTFLKTTTAAENVERYDELLDRLRERFRFVFISESKRADYGLAGDVIVPGIDVDEWGGYTGKVPEVLRVGNTMRARDLMFDVDFQERVCDGVPNQVVGYDPLIPGARESSSFQHLLRLYRSRRCLLHVTRQEFEDGYNFSTLEAMACGMPVVSLANTTSPLTDGVDGYVSEDAEILRERLTQLLTDVDLARAIGARGRETVARKFPINVFVENWRRVLEQAAQSGPKRRAVPRKPPEQKPLNILLHYIASPITTGRYFEAAARKRHHVVTAGFRCPERVLQYWGFSPPFSEYPRQQIDLALEDSCEELSRKLPAGFEPDFYLWIDSGAGKVPAGLESLNVPKACYLIDTHIDLNLRIQMARHFDFVFLAQKTQLEAFQQAGIKHVQWLPLACHPELHAPHVHPRTIDVAHVGSVLSDGANRRARLLRTIQERFPNSRFGRFWPDEMARIYAQSKIVFNEAVNHDMNMRVFEALASGALLITDEADGLEELFEDGRHLAIYRDDETMPELIDRFLTDENRRQSIAEAGRQRVLERHTYEQRIAEIIRVLTENGAFPRARTATGAVRGSLEYYSNLRPEVAQFVPITTRRLLDVGCGCGTFGAGLKQRGIKEVYGIELSAAACVEAARVLDQAVCGNIEQMELPFENGYFDCITFNDVLEHLIDPAAALSKAARVLADDGVILMSIPNVRFFPVIAMLANGRWQYADSGILDRTHLRFFTRKEIEELVRSAGLEILELDSLSMWPRERVPMDENGALVADRIAVMPTDEQDLKDLLTYQYLVIAGKPGGDRLAKARAALDARQNEMAYVCAQEARGVEAFERKRIMGKAAVRMGRLTEAETLYRELLSERPRDSEVLGDLGILLIAMNRIEEAGPFLKRAADLAPQDEHIIGALGLLYQHEGKQAEAFDHLRRALEAGHENVALLPAFVALAEQMNRCEGIEELVRRYADFYPASTEVVTCHVRILANLRRWAEARDRLESILMLDPANTTLRDLLSEVRERIGS